ncbi:MAG: PTS sugar transporter subunit IIA [Alphaproteobacteria bacterium]
MRNMKELDFDLFLARLKAQTQDRAFELLAEHSAALCGTEVSVLRKVFARRLSERTFGMGDGISIFDVKSEKIKSPVLAMLTFDQDIDFNALDNKPVNVMAAVISPRSSGPFHLQRLASISRVLRAQELCDALRDARDEDAMRVLFMPSQDWMIAA